MIFFLAIKEIRNTLDLLSTAIQQSFYIKIIPKSFVISFFSDEKIRSIITILFAMKYVLFFNNFQWKTIMYIFLVDKLMAKLFASKILSESMLQFTIYVPFPRRDLICTTDIAKLFEIDGHKVRKDMINLSLS